jgi:hypothetical protein
MEGELALLQDQYRKQFSGLQRRWRQDFSRELVLASFEPILTVS